jgi:hypothetical protein
MKLDQILMLVIPQQCISRAQKAVLSPVKNNIFIRLNWQPFSSKDTHCWDTTSDKNLTYIITTICSCDQALKAVLLSCKEQYFNSLELATFLEQRYALLRYDKWQKFDLYNNYYLSHDQALKDVLSLVKDNIFIHFEW